MLSLRELERIQGFLDPALRGHKVQALVQPDEYTVAIETYGREDGEGALLARIRDIAPETPMAISLDMHTNMYPAIVENTDIIAGYQTYPHVDVYETGMRAGRAFFKMIKDILFHSDQ